MTDQGVVYSKLTLDESVSKLQIIKQLSLNITAWKDLNNYIQCLVEKVELIDNSIFVIFSKNLNKINSGSKIYFYFNQSPIDYFFCGTPQIQDNGKLTIKLDDQIVRSEKRKTNRIFAFPHRNIFFNIQTNYGKKSENIVFFNKTDRNAKKLFLKYLSETQNSGSYSIKRFRVLDISKEGISFLVNKGERKIFENSHFKEAQILISDTVFEIGKFNVKSVVNYIDSRCKNISMFKVGVLFNKQNDELNELIDSYTSRILSITSLHEEFYKFIKKKYD